MNAAIITAQARPPETAFGNRRPSDALTRKPASGSSGISTSKRSPLQRGESVGTQRLAMPEERDDEREPDGGFGGRDRHDEERDDLAVDDAVEAPGGNE